MKKSKILGLAAALALVAAPAMANTVWGTVTSVTPGSISLTSASGDAKTQADCTLTITDRTQFKGIGGTSQLTQGDKVKVDVEKKAGAMKAKSIEKVDSIPAGQENKSNFSADKTPGRNMRPSESASEAPSQTVSANQTADASSVDKTRVY